MLPTTTLMLADDVKIVVPDSLNLITGYVLQEQQDWFEDESLFVRRLLEPGDNVMDIGANYGVYTLPMAKCVGSTGRVWAFEPASGTAQLLAEGIAANGFTHVVLEQSAVSSCSGTAQLSVNDNSELNALVTSPSDSGPCATVPVVTLDETVDRYGIQSIDFLKIDAEGEESNILRGADRFFSEFSPLVQYEVKTGAVLHTELVDAFDALGYSSYRLVPGLNVLVPFSRDSQPDSYLLNLFSCKPDRAQRLADRGLLVMVDDPGSSAQIKGDRKWTQEALNTSCYDWNHTIARQPYGIHLSSLWTETVALGNSADVVKALSLYALSRDTKRCPSERVAALESSLGLLKPLCRRHPAYLRLASLARVAADSGERQLAVNALRQLAMEISLHQRADPSEPFLVPGEAFESVSFEGVNIGNWIFAAVLEQIERLEFYSSFYSGLSSLPRLELIDKLGHGSAEMDRRLQLVKRRFRQDSD